MSCWQLRKNDQPSCTKGHARLSFEKWREELRACCNNTFWKPRWTVTRRAFGKNHLGINKSKTLCLSRFFSQKGCKCIRYSAKVIHPSQRSERTKSQPIGLNNLAAAALSAQLHTPPLINFCYDYSTTVVLFSSPTRQTCWETCGLHLLLLLLWTHYNIVQGGRHHLHQVFVVGWVLPWSDKLR